MSISKEFLLEAVGLSLLVALLLVGVKVFQRTNDFISAMDREQERRIEEWQEYEVVQYDGRVVDGITAISYIRNTVGQYNVPIYVETIEHAFWITKPEDYKGLRDMTSEHYMNTLALYQCQVIRNENDSIEQVEIRVQREEEDE